MEEEEEDDDGGEEILSSCPVVHSKVPLRQEINPSDICLHCLFVQLLYFCRSFKMLHILRKVLYSWPVSRCDGWRNAQHTSDWLG